MKTLRALCLVVAAAAAASAAPRPAKRSIPPLWTRVSNWLNADPVIKAQPVAAVAAVRGGIPTDQGEDLDQLLLDRAAPLRQKLLSPRGGEADRSAARSIYDALALSQYVQTAELKDAATSGDARAAIKNWARAHPSLPAPLADALAAPDLGGAALVKAGWGGYCRGLAAGAPAPAPGPDSGFVPDESSAKLDELLDGVRGAWTQKKLQPGDQARAHLLAGQLYAALAKAPLSRRKAAASGGVASAPAAAAPQPSSPRRAAPTAQAPTPSTLPEFVPRTIYDKASPSVVLIMCSAPDGGGELGSGSLIGNGRVLTNAHVVIRDSTRKPWPKIHVYFKPAKLTGDAKQDLANPVDASARAWDAGLDLAMIDISSEGGRQALALADPDSVSIGDRVAAIGHPEQGGLWTLTTGVVGTVVANLGGVEGKRAIQTDASINRGNSGGPLLNAAGDIVGVNTLMSRKAADGLAITGVDFAVRSDVAQHWLAAVGQAVTYAATAPAPAALVGGAADAPPAAVPAPKAPQFPTTKPAKKEMITESKPFDRDQLIQREIQEMESLEKEMRDEIKRVRK